MKHKSATKGWQSSLYTLYSLPDSSWQQTDLTSFSVSVGGIMRLFLPSLSAEFYVDFLPFLKHSMEANIIDANVVMPSIML